MSHLSLAKSPSPRPSYCTTEHGGILHMDRDDGSPTQQQNAKDIRRELLDLQSTRSITRFLEEKVLGNSNHFSRFLVAAIATIYRWLSWSCYHGWTFFDTFIVVCSFIDIIWLLVCAGATD